MHIGIGKLSDSVIGYEVRQLLRLRCVILVVNRNLRQPFKLGGCESAMSSHNQPRSETDGDGVSPTGAADDGAQPFELFVRVHIRVFRVRPHLPHRHDCVVGTVNGDPVGVALYFFFLVAMFVSSLFICFATLDSRLDGRY